MVRSDDSLSLTQTHSVPHPHMLLHLPSQVRRAGQIPHQAHHVRRFHFMRRVPGLPLGMRILSMSKCIGNRVHAWLRCCVLRCRKPLRRKLVSLLRLCDCATDRDWIHETVNARCRRFNCACESYVSIISAIRWLGQQLHICPAPKQTNPVLPLRSV